MNMEESSGEKPGKMGMSEGECKVYNHGDMKPEDFESGEFGSLDGDFGQPGDKVNFMAKGIVGDDGRLKVDSLAVLGGYEEESVEEKEEKPRGGVMLKIMGEGE